ncbi:MAG TPA: TonB-dependent receptor [Gemmatimonadales bacterium]|nr:TonB-dependent receptor [Gemmatimonadales bacterium]
MRRPALSSFLLALALTASPAAAQAPVTGVVVDSISRQPLPGAEVRVLAADGRVMARTTAGPRGAFRLPVPVGAARLQGVFPGYRPAVAPATTSARLALVRVHRLADQVVTPERGAGSALDAPTALSVLGAEALGRELPVGGPARQLEAVPGLAIAEKGLMQASFSTRGPGSINSASLLMLTDFRLASVPALRLNIPYLLPPSDEDIARVEVVRGPGSALYGPDADRGVVHFITRSPLDAPGGTASFTTGSRSVAQGAVRYAARLGANAGVKVSGAYLTGEDWPITDPADSAPHTELTQRFSADLRADWAPEAGTTVVLAGGVAEAVRAVDLTEAGGVQLRNWRTGYAQARVERGRLFANAFLNANDAGDSYFLRTGLPVVEESRTWAAQLQHGADAGPVALRYGVDVQRVIPRTGGTIHGRNEDDDDIWQAGGWVQGVLPASPALELVAALRGDRHDRLDDFEVAPRVGLVWRPAPAHAFRLTFNRASSTPVANDLFVDFVVGELPPELGYDPIRAAGTAHAWSFRRDCGGTGGFCMRSPFTPPELGGPGQYVPAEGTQYWPVVQALADGALDGVPAPTPDQVPTILAALDPSSGVFVPVDPARVTDVPRGRRSITTSFEGGWRGQLGSRFTAAVDVYRSRISNVGSALSVQTPNAFLDPAALATYLQGVGYPADAAQAIAAEVGQLPLGTVSPVEALDPTAILVIPRQGGEAEFWGTDFDLAWELGGGFTAAGRFSWVSEDLFEGAAGIADVALNAPRTSGALGVRWRADRVWASVTGRAEAGFPARSGEYAGPVEGFGVVDAGVGVALPWAAGASLTLSGTDLFDRGHQAMPGAPVIGRLLLVRVRSGF